MSRHRSGLATQVSDRGAQLGYRPTLDGLRAVAVIAVMLYHGGVPWARGGFLGVDIFFVLSGFLITSLLVQEWRRTGRIKLRAFWLRRARRLFPAMLAVLLAVAVFFAVVPQQQPRLRGDALATLGYVSNWWFMVTDQSYFAQFLDPSPLRHTWSLAIEEQYYIAFPILLVLLLGRVRLGLAAVRALLLLGVVGSAGLMAALYDPLSDPSRVYYGTDTRIHALLVGAVLALSPALTRHSRSTYARLKGRLVPLPGASVLGWLGLVGLLVLVVAAREAAPWMYRGGFLLTAVLTAIVIASVTVDPLSALGRVLALRPLVAIGVVSYGLYLWHWPVFIVLDRERSGLDGPLLLVVRFTVTGLLAYLSYRFIEEPIRAQQLQRRFTPTQWARIVAAAVASVTTVVLWASVAAQPAVQASVLAGERPSPVPDAQGRLVRAFLLGDSQSWRLRMNYKNQVDGLAVGGSTQLGCGTLLPEWFVAGHTIPNLPACVEWEPRWTQEVAQDSPDVFVLMLGLGELYDRSVDGTVLKVGTPAYHDWLYREIDRRRAIAKEHATSFALTTVLCMKVSVDAANETSHFANDPSRLRWLNDTIRSYARTHHDVKLIDLYETLCSRGFTEQLNGVTLRDDGLHLTPEGSALVWAKIGPQLVDSVP